MLPNRHEIAVVSDTYPVSSPDAQKPSALTPEVMMFFGLMVFLAVFGVRKGST